MNSVDPQAWLTAMVQVHKQSKIDELP